MITFMLPAYLRSFAAGQGEVRVDAAPTVGEALEHVFAKHPGLRHRVLTETGEVRQHVNIFVGDESVRYSGGLVTPLTDGVVVSIVPAVSGG